MFSITNWSIVSIKNSTIIQNEREREREREREIPDHKTKSTTNYQNCPGKTEEDKRKKEKKKLTSKTLSNTVRWWRYDLMGFQGLQWCCWKINLSHCIINTPENSEFWHMCVYTCVSFWILFYYFSFWKCLNSMANGVWK